MSNWNGWLNEDDDSEFVEVRKSYSDVELIQILRNEGYSPVKRLKEGIIVFQAESTNYLLFNQEDTLQIAIIFNDTDHLSYKKLNEWNSTYRFSRAYINEDNRTINLDNNLDLQAGVSEQQIIRFIAKFRLLAQVFKNFT